MAAKKRKSTPILCQVCGVEAPARHVEFHQNIGMLVARQHKSIKGNLCKNCIHQQFWKMTGTNLVLGWWGYISLVCTPIFIVNNVVRYIGMLGMEGVPAMARVPKLTEEVVAKIAPQQGELLRRLNGGEDLNDVARAVAPACGATPGEVVHYVIALSKAQRQRALGQAPTFGFPVVTGQSKAAPPPLPLPAIPIEEGAGG